MNVINVHGEKVKITGVIFMKSVHLQATPSSLDENDKCAVRLMRVFNFDLICSLSKATLLWNVRK